MIQLFDQVLSLEQVALFCLVGLLVGMAKVGVSGAGMIAVPTLAIVFGGRNSSGLMLPMLIMADFFGVGYYHRHAQWKHLKRLLPFALVGIVIGTVVGAYIDDEVFRLIMAVIIFISLGIMIWLERESDSVPMNWLFAASTGVAGGFTTMVGNLAGSVMGVYLLAMRMPKSQFIGTAAWFFLIINVSKVPFHVFAWGTITWNTFLLDLTTLPFIGIGAAVGIQVVKRIPEKWYRYFIILMTAVAAVFMVV